MAAIAVTRTPFLQSGVCYYQLWISGITNALASFLNILLQIFIASQGWNGRKCGSDQIWINAFWTAFQCTTLTFATSFYVDNASLVHFIRKPRKTTANVKLFHSRFMLRGVEFVHKSLLACVSIQAQYVREGDKLRWTLDEIMWGRKVCYFS